MIYLIYGNNRQRVKEKAKGFLELEKKGGANLHIINDKEEDISSKIRELAVAQDFFSPKQVLVLDHMVSDKMLIDEEKDSFWKAVEDFGDSSNLVILLEREFLKTDLKRLEKRGAKVFCFELVEKAEKFNTFSLGDAFGERNKKRLWLQFRRALESGISAEEIQGVLFWQAEMLSFVILCKNAKEIGASDYPFNKAKRYAKNFSEKEILDLPFRIVSLVHESRRRGEDLSTALEKFILSV